MKILTNVQTSGSGGIGQTFLTFLNYLGRENRKDISVVGVEINKDPNCVKDSQYRKVSGADFELISLNIDIPIIYNVVNDSQTIGQVKETYGELIDAFGRVIDKEKPDLILINGTYFVPWCLFLAGKMTQVPMVLHYHGVITKETAHLEERQRKIFNEMEKVFDNDRLFYVFPSELARKVVEEEIFGHEICRKAVLPNGIPDHFFDVDPVKHSRKVGLVGRWSSIKNLNFIEDLAKYNSDNGGRFSVQMVTDPKKVKKENRKVEKWMEIVEPMDNEHLADFYRRMGVVISPSFFETYGNVPQEAIACGVPALISKNMGVAETYKAMGLNNWIIDFDEVEKVYEQIEEIRKERVEKKIREKFRENYCTDVINGRLVNILNSV